MMTLYNKDCIDMVSDIADNTIDLIVTDPPYKVMTNGGGGTVNSVLKLNQSLQDLHNHTDITDGYDIITFNELFIQKMKDINIYLWCNKVQIPQYFTLYVDKYKCKFDIICWHKTNALPTYSNKYLTDTEYCLYFHKGQGKCFPQRYNDAKTFYVSSINYKDKNLYGHPTIKPLEIIRCMVRNSSKPNDIILDPFMGSGTTGVACKIEHRKFIGYEVDPHYFNIAKQRIDSTMNKRSLFTV